MGFHGRKWFVVEDEHRPNKVLIFHIAAGQSDARPIRGKIADKPYSDIHALWVVTHMGTVGHHFTWIGRDARMREYRVIDKREEENEIVITCYVENGDKGTG